MTYSYTPVQVNKGKIEILKMTGIFWETATELKSTPVVSEAFHNPNTGKQDKFYGVREYADITLTGLFSETQITTIENVLNSPAGADGTLTASYQIGNKTYRLIGVKLGEWTPNTGGFDAKSNNAVKCSLSISYAGIQ